MFAYRVSANVEWCQHSMEHTRWNRIVVAESEMDAKKVLSDYLYARHAKHVRVTTATLEIASPMIVKGHF